MDRNGNRGIYRRGPQLLFWNRESVRPPVLRHGCSSCNLVLFFYEKASYLPLAAKVSYIIQQGSWNCYFFFSETGHKNRNCQKNQDIYPYSVFHSEQNWNCGYAQQQAVYTVDGSAFQIMDHIQLRKDGFCLHPNTNSTH